MPDSFSIKAPSACRWDVVALGEVLLRLDPGEQRITQARTFAAWEGGGEYNVARALARGFAQRAAVATALVDNPVGRLVESLMLSGRVDTSHLLWRADDGSARNGTYFMERGFGLRSALAAMDRSHSAASQLQPGQMDWGRIFADEGVRWFHTGGIFAGLAPGTLGVVREAMEAARQQGTVVSYDCNYRPSLWAARGGRAAAAQANRTLLPLVDVLFGHEEDMLPVVEANTVSAPPVYTPATFTAMAERLFAGAPQLKLIACPQRTAPSANRNTWSAFAHDRNQLHAAPPYHELEILDRVGGGDAFAAGLVHGLLAGEPVEWSLRCGLAHGALVMTTPGDTSFATLHEVTRLMAGHSAHAQR